MKSRLSVVGAVGAALWMAGCASKPAADARPPTASERGERAIQDPFRYKVDWDDTDVTGGDTGELDRKGLQRDLGHVLMP